jgi:putative hemolysin
LEPQYHYHFYQKERKMKAFTLFILFGLLLGACAPNTVDPAANSEANLPNPASVYCEEQGYTLETVTAEDGSQAGLCVFPDGSKCDEWAFFHGDCKPGDHSIGVWMSNPATVYCRDQGYTSETVTAEDGSQAGFCVFLDGSKCDEWAFYRGECKPGQDTSSDPNIALDGCRIYRNEALGYSFHYPANATVVNNDEPLQSFTIQGPLENGEFWPQFTISHPAGREDYHPDENVFLERWLAEHNLLAGARQPDLWIGGVPAIHVRHDSSPQSYAYDQYFFAKSGQLYTIVIGHTGNKEDWRLYHHFLSSFQFDN